jgi:hypothetical protein
MNPERLQNPHVLKTYICEGEFRLTKEACRKVLIFPSFPVQQPFTPFFFFTLFFFLVSAFNTMRLPALKFFKHRTLLV